MKSKNKKWILIGTIMTILLIVFLWPKTSDVEKEDSTPIQEIKEFCSGCTISETRDTITMSGYDYIISVMSSPQYWGVDYLPLYNLDYEQEYSYEKLIAQNGTGWILKDEASATFERGSEGILTISFADNKANIKTWTNVYASNENNTLDYDATEYNFDYNNNSYEYIAPYGNTANNHNYDYEVVLSNRVIKPQTEEEFKESGNLFDERFTVKNIILYYEDLFSKAGCPLLNQPEGTLESYKNKQVIIEKPKKDNLIHAIWEQEDFSWQWDQREDLVWLDDYKEIFNKDVKESELEKIDWDGKEKTLATYSPLYLVLVNKKDCTFKYLDRNPNTATLFLSLDEYFDAEAGALATYFLMPMTKQIYGYNGVYFYDTNKLPNSNNSYQFVFNSKEDFLNNLSYPKDISSSSILTIHKYGDIPVSLVALEGDKCSSLNKDMFLPMKQIADYYKVDFPYADDYMFNFFIYYNATAQRLLGLR